uniref:Uncharacterized protein n=1 Tax=Brassica oleracea TaxID=3712 RepID=A0A3P6EM01_BRAOL|nr:unnamed protein product [Brassica oleracea]
MTQGLEFVGSYWLASAYMWIHTVDGSLQRREPSYLQVCWDEWCLST